MEKHIVVYITAGSAEETEKLNYGLVEEKLVFCVNAVPSVKSTYYREGKNHCLHRPGCGHQKDPSTLGSV